MAKGDIVLITFPFTDLKQFRLHSPVFDAILQFLHHKP